MSEKNPQYIKKCIVNGCNKNLIAKGLCWTHYKRNKRYGNVNYIILKSDVIRENHGMSGTKIHRLWSSILKTCKKNGIEIHEPWKIGFSSFYKDVGDQPKDKPIFIRKNHGKGFTPENCEWSKKSISENRKKVKCIETGVIYNSIADASEYLGIDRTSITHALNGASKTSGGYHWEYY